MQFSVNKYYMKKFIVFEIISVVFRLLLIFLISFVWLRYITRDFKLSVILSIFTTLVVDFTIKFFSDKKKRKGILKEKEKQEIESYINTFIFNDDNYSVNFFYNLATKRHTATKNRRFVTVIHPESKIILFPFFLYRAFDTDDLIFIYNNIKNQEFSKLIICTNKISPDAIKLCKKINSKIILLDGEQTYLKLLLEYNFYPEKMPSLKQTETLSWKDLLAYTLNKKRTKGYFLSSIVLLISSFVVSYNLYYVIMSSVLLLLALVSFINPKFNKPKVEENLLS